MRALANQKVARITKRGLLKLNLRNPLALPLFQILTKEKFNS